MTADAQLLRDYATGKSQDAFTELVRRHIDLVFSAALRQVRESPRQKMGDGDVLSIDHTP